MTHAKAKALTHLDEQADRTTLVVGASRGLGRGIATAIAEVGGSVIAVARSQRDRAGRARWHGPLLTGAGVQPLPPPAGPPADRRPTERPVAARSGV